MAATMRAARAYEGEKQLRLEQVPVPELGPDDVLVRVAAAGLTPVVMKQLEFRRYRHLPTVPGHEVAGAVVETGADVDRAWLDRRVRVHPMLSCGNCQACRTGREQICAEAAMLGGGGFGSGPMALYARYHDGGLAEYVRAPAHLLDPLPDAVTFEVGAKVHDFANAVCALGAMDLPLGSTLVVSAATGTMGTAIVKLAPFFGCGRLVLVARSRERLASVRRLAGPLAVELVPLEELGADWERDGELTTRLRKVMSDGAHGVLDLFPGGAGTAQLLGALANGRTLVHMGGNRTPLPQPVNVLMHGMHRVVGTRGCSRTDVHQVLDLMRHGSLRADELITHRYELGEVNTALARLRDRVEPSWMTVVHP